MLLFEAGVHMSPNKKKKKRRITPKHLSTERLGKMLATTPKAGQLILPFEHILLEYAQRVKNVLELPQLMTMHLEYMDLWKITKSPSKFNVLAEVAGIILKTAIASPFMVALDETVKPHLTFLEENGYQVTVIMNNKEHVSFVDWYIECRKSSIVPLHDELKKAILPPELIALFADVSVKPYVS